MAKYRLIEHGVLDTETGATIPSAQHNSDWLAYLEWLDAENAPDPAITATLDEQRAAAKDDVDAAAGRIRAKYITSVPGQSATYLMKYDEAVAYIGAGYPPEAEADVPHLASEALATGSTIAEIADAVVSTRAVWYQLSAQIEGARMGGKSAIDAAIDAEGVELARAAAVAALA